MYGDVEEIKIDEEERHHTKRLQSSRGSVLAFRTKVRGIKPGRIRRIFQGEKILSTPSFGREVKVVLSRVADLRHVKEPYSSVNSLISGQIYGSFLAQ
jgi:hypothetical protein